jgi:hypothetical protein
MIIHFAWPYLIANGSENYDDCMLSVVFIPPAALLFHVGFDCHPQTRPPQTWQTHQRITHGPVALVHKLLLRFHFNYGDFVRWLGGEYTNRSQNWDETFATLWTARQRQPPLHFPPADYYPRGKRMFTEGVPLRGNFVSLSAELSAGDQNNIHLAVQDNYEAVEQKFAKEEEKSFHIHLPRFLLHFIAGLMLNPLQWAWQKGKGLICVDCTNGPDGPDTDRSENTHIPKPSEENADKCPPVFYMTAFQRFLINIWCLHITYPHSLGS